MWSGKTGLEKSQIKPEITHPYETLKWSGLVGLPSSLKASELCE
jgi:hypothetical protein